METWGIQPPEVKSLARTDVEFWLDRKTAMPLLQVRDGDWYHGNRRQIEIR